MLSGDSILNGENIVYHNLNIALNTCEGENLAEVVAVSGLNLGILLVDVVVAVAHTKTTLLQVEDSHIAICKVGSGVSCEEYADTIGVKLGDRCHQCLTVCCCEDSVESLTDRLSTLSIEALLVKTHLVEVRNLLLDGAYLSFSLGHLREELVDAYLVVLAKNIERAVA